MKKRILCFGDSNTWGYIANQPTICRYDENTRWTGRLQALLGTDATILEFGLCGCESGFKNRNKCYNANAQDLYPSILFANLPVDLVVLMLGTNDLKTQNHWKNGDTAKNLDALISVTHTLAPSARLVLATPVLLRDGIESDAEFSRDAIALSARCAEEVAALAHKRHIPLFDTNQWVHELDTDGCHFTPAAHKAFAEEMAAFLKPIISD